MNTVRLFRFGMRLLPALPEPLIYGACELAGLVLLLVSGKTRRAVLSNMRRVAPGRRGLAALSLAQQVIANGLKHHADILRLPSMSAAELRSRCEFSGLSYLSQLQAAGKGGIMAVAHTGSFSLVGAALSELALCRAHRAARAA
jgi:lauroyl/myristoyl acyltransferase